MAARSSSNGHKIRNYLTKRRVAGFALALVIVISSLWGLFFYRPAPDKPTDPSFRYTYPPMPTKDASSLEAKVTTSGFGEGVAGFDTRRTYHPGDPAVVGGELAYEAFGDRMQLAIYKRGGEAYARQGWTNASTFRAARDIIEENEEFTLVRDDSVNLTLFYEYSPDSQVKATPDGFLFAGLTLALTWSAMVPYERRGTTTFQGREVVRYVPTAGWVNRAVPELPSDGIRSPRYYVSTQQYYVRSASGEVLVDPDSGAVLKANIEGTAIFAKTWGSAVIKPVLLDEPEPIHLSVRYRLETAVNRPSPSQGLDEIVPRRNVSSS